MTTVDTGAALTTTAAYIVGRDTCAAQTHPSLRAWTDGALTLPPMPFAG